VSCAVGGGFKGLRTAFVIFFGAVDSGGSWFSLVAMGAVFFVSPMSAWEIRETVSGLLQTRTISPIRQATLRIKNKGPALRLRLFEFTGTTLALCRVFSHSAKVLRSVCETCRQGRLNPSVLEIPWLFQSEMSKESLFNVIEQFRS